MDRRNFLKSLGIGGVITATGVVFVPKTPVAWSKVNELGILAMGDLLHNMVVRVDREGNLTIEEFNFMLQEAYDGDGRRKIED